MNSLSFLKPVVYQVGDDGSDLPGEEGGYLITDVVEDCQWTVMIKARYAFRWMYYCF